jgi:hypothetical protein
VFLEVLTSRRVRRKLYLGLGIYIYGSLETRIYIYYGAHCTWRWTAEKRSVDPCACNRDCIFGVAANGTGSCFKTRRLQ